MSEINEITERIQNCVWLKKKVCHIPDINPCPDDCDLKTLKFNSDEIIKRMREEESNIHKLKKEGMFKNRLKIKDKFGGIVVLQRVLKEHFKHTEPHIVDKDIERTPMFPSKGWRR